MKQALKSIAAAILFAAISTSVYAVETPKPDAMPMGGMGMGMHHGMMAGMTEEQKDKHLRSMQEHMLKMHDLSNQILAEKDATKKEQLKTQQLQLMKEHHAEMRERHQQMKHTPPPQK
jgi:hypothetical protein